MSTHSTPTLRPIALVGLSGSGKSSVGRQLRTLLGWPLLDTDALIVEQAGCEIAQIFAEQGEAVFRDMEAAALRQALVEPLAIVATGGGIVLRPENRALLRERAFVIWLDASTEELLARLQAHDEQRPLLQGDMAARIEGQRAARAALYAEVAHLQIITQGRSIEAIAEEIVAAQQAALSPTQS